MRLADEFPIDIVSVDSALVYRGMDVGTAKPSRDELRRYPHRLIDIRDPEKTYSAGEFVADALQEIAAIQQNGRVPILVGGTMMYFRSLIDGIACLPKADRTVRQSIDAEAAASSWPALHAALEAIDAAAAEKINPNDSQRIQRALEVYRISGRTLSEWQLETATVDGPMVGTFIKVALIPEPRSILHERIQDRLHRMLDNNFIEEVNILMQRAELTQNHASMRAVGYRQFWSHLQGDISFDEASAKALAATRQLAKRQLTWLRREQDILIVNPLETDAFAAISGHLRDQLLAQ